MFKLSATKQEHFQLQRTNDCKERSELFAKMLQRKSLQELNDLVTFEVNTFDNEILECILQCIDLLDKYDAKVNEIIHEFNQNKVEYIGESITSDTVDKLYMELINRLNNIIHGEEVENTFEDLINKMSRRTQLTISHVRLICVVSASKGVAKVYARKERYINYNIISKLYYWGDYLLRRLFDSTDYITSYIHNCLLEQISCTNIKHKLNETNIKIVEIVNKERERYSNLYRSRELNKLAKDCGYRKVRQKGDHGVFKKEDGQIVVIPQGRFIGKGLSYKIQKSVLY